jgi:hypothetical protein
MRKSRAAAAVAVALTIVAVAAPQAGAQTTTPNGPWEQPNQNESLSAIRGYD